MMNINIYKIDIFVFIALMIICSFFIFYNRILNDKLKKLELCFIDFKKYNCEHQIDYFLNIDKQKLSEDIILDVSIEDKNNNLKDIKKNLYVLFLKKKSYIDEYFLDDFFKSLWYELIQVNTGYALIKSIREINLFKNFFKIKCVNFQYKQKECENKIINSVCLKKNEYEINLYKYKLDILKNKKQDLILKIFIRYIIGFGMFLIIKYF